MVLNSCEGKFSDSLDVRFTKACDNACSFCIEAPGLPSQGPSNVPAMIAGTLSAGKKEVLILGGEPLLQPKKVLEYIDGIRHHVDKVFLTTALPLTITRNRDIIAEIVAKLDGINVSIQHHDWVRNNEILRARHRYNRIELLTDLLRDDEFALKARVSINLVKGAIDTSDKLTECLNTLAGMGVRHVKINEMQHAPDVYVSYRALTGNGHADPFASGCQYELEPHREMRVTLKQACFLVEPSIEPTWLEIGKYTQMHEAGWPTSTCKVMYENGRVENGWL